MNERITLATSTYDITFPLTRGRINPEGVDLNVLSNFFVIDHFERMYAHSEFDVCEYSLTLHIINWDRGDKRFVGLPILLNRQFIQKNLYTRIDSGLKSAKDLEGKSIGLPIYQNARWIWTRGAFEDYYGVDPTKIKWYTERPERINIKLPSGIKLNRLPKGMKSVEALEKGVIDVMGTFNKPESKKITKLFPDSRKEEREYFKKTGLFPAMHLVVVKKEVLDRIPWLAQGLMKAFQESKELCYEVRDKLSAQGGSTNVWMDESLREQKEILGDDPYPFGLAANMPELKVWVDYLYRQGFISKKPELSSLFAPGLDKVRGDW